MFQHSQWYGRESLKKLKIRQLGQYGHNNEAAAAEEQTSMYACCITSKQQETHPLTYTQPVKVERLVNNRLDMVDVDDIQIGDVVEVPVWLDIWYGPAGLSVQPWAIISFDRVVVLKKRSKVSTPKTL